VPWRLPDEFAHFKRTTMGKPIIMGRKTYEDHNSALPGRLNIVVTAQPDYPVAGKVAIAHSLAEALELAHEHDEEVFVVGGSGLFATSFPHADRVYETIVHVKIPDGDTYVPAFDFSGWACRKLEEHMADTRHAHAFTVYCYERPR
jgi:dihydrofolate reductase